MVADLYLTPVSLRCGLTWQILVAVVNGGGIYISRDSGDNWGPVNVPNNQWVAVASSKFGEVSRAGLLQL